MAPLQHPWGHTPSLGPGLWRRSAAGPPKTPILGNPGALSPKVSLKTSFPWVPTRRDEYPHAPSTTSTGSHPSLGPAHRLHWGHTLAQPWSERPPPQDSCTRGLTKKRVFPGYQPTLQGTHMAPLQHPWGHTPSLGPGLWRRSAAGPPKTPILGNPGALSPKVSLKNEFPWVPTRRDEYPHAPSTTSTGSHP